MTLNWRQNGPARPKTACCSSGSAPRVFSLQPGWLFGLSLSRISPRLLRAGGRLLHRRCAAMFTSQKPCQSSGRYCVVPLNLLAPPWMLWRAFWPPSSQRCPFAGFRVGSCRGPVWSLPISWDAPLRLWRWVPFARGFCKAAGAEAHHAPLSV